VARFAGYEPNAREDQQTDSRQAVRPLSLTIPGDYWDSYVYAGRLYLFERDGSIRTLSWDRLIREWKVPARLRVALHVAFAQSDYLYGRRLAVLFDDPEIRRLLERKFSALAARDLQLSKRQLDAATIRVQENPFPFPHSDCTIYDRALYVVSPDGVSRATCGRRTRYPVSTRPTREWDCPTNAVAASYGSLALATGDEGLYEMQIGRALSWDFEERLTQLTQRHSSDCSWAYYSIFASSHFAGGTLADFTRVQVPIPYDEDLADEIWPRRPLESRSVRRLQQLVESDAIFGSAGYSWGRQDKLYQASSGSVRAVRYTPWASDGERFESLGELRLEGWKGNIVSGGVAAYGVIVEAESAIVVWPSAGMTHTIPGEPINWRVFPRSVQYENHLHVVYDDHLLVLSFNHDYFVDQDAKRAGIKVRLD
jgi:hypothetical protein